MDHTDNLATDDEATLPYSSFASLRDAHSDLLKRHRESGSLEECLAEVETFIRRGQATGTLLGTEDERWSSQSLLDYWSSMMYRAGHQPLDATLAEFDPSLAPELDDVLCPYLGLDAFREVNNGVFFGRERLIKEMINQLRENRLLAVVGASGSGKSSLVRAGLLPALKAGALPGSQRWCYYAPMVPGSTPLANLAKLIQPSGASEANSIQRHVNLFQQDAAHLSRLVGKLHQGPTVVVVDQFEELFTLCRDNQECQAFVDNLLGLIQAPETRHTVILTMRTDFESHVARLPQLQPLFEEAQVRVMPMNASELRAAIEKPAEKVGLKFEEGVVESLLQDMLGEPAALPLLQFTLLKLWENRDRNRVTWEAYRRLGGGRLALARSADEFYDALIPEEQLTARRILLRMVRPGEGLEITSNRIRRETLFQASEARDRVERVLDRLVQARLVRLTESEASADAQVEVAHEALVRNWPRLVNWLEEERENMRRRLRLTSAAEQWEALGKKSDGLWRGSLLDEALRYKDLSELEAEFIQASQDAEKEAREKELRQARERAEEQATAARRLRLALAALAALFILTIGAGALVIKQTQDNARLAIAATAEAGNAAAAVTQAAAKEELVAALDAQATAVAQLATAEARGEEITGAQATIQAIEAAAVAAREADQIREATAVAARATAEAVARGTPVTPLAPSPTPAATPTVAPTPTHTPTPSPEPPEKAVANQAAAIFAAPRADSATLGFIQVGESVTVLGRSADGRWLYVRGPDSVDGFVFLPYFNWPGDPGSLPTRLPTVTVTPMPTPSPSAGPFALVYMGCQSHSSDLGWVKGQVFNAAGQVIPGAQVEIWIDGQYWDNPANPATTNQDGWYEWILGTGQTIRFVTLYIGGQPVPFQADPDPFEVQAQAGCFQQVDFRQR